MRRKIALSFLVAIYVLVTQIQAMLVQAADQVAYERQYLEYPLFNAAMKAAPGDFIEKSGNSAFNVIDRFTKVKKNSSAPGALSFDATVSGCGYIEQYTFEFNPKEYILAQKGDIAAAFSANLTNNYHMNFTQHWNEMISYPHAILGSAPYSHSSWGKALHDSWMVQKSAQQYR